MAATADADPGDITLRTYEASAERYRESVASPGPAISAFLDRIAATAGPGARVLELGSGPGQDAVALERWGLQVTRTDATRAFVEMLRADGYQAELLDARHDDFGGPYDVVLADAVLLHLDRVQFRRVLTKAQAAVVAGGLLAVTLKEGDGEEWHSRKLDLPRHFTYWREEPLRAELTATRWNAIYFERISGRFDDWLYVLARAD